MRLCLVIFLIQMNSAYSMETDDTLDIFGAHSTTNRKNVLTFFCCLQKLSYNVPKDIKVKIISYVPQLLYYPGMITLALVHIEKNELFKFVKELSYDSLKAYLAQSSIAAALNKNIIIDLMQYEIDTREKDRAQKRMFFLKEVLWIERSWVK